MTNDNIIMLCRAARKAHGITQEQLAIKSGWSVSSISWFEHGHYSAELAKQYRNYVLNPAEQNTFDRIMEEWER